MDEFSPLDLQPHSGKQWAPVAAGKGKGKGKGSMSTLVLHVSR